MARRRTPVPRLDLPGPRPVAIPAPKPRNRPAIPSVASLRQQPSRLDRWADLVLGPKQPPTPAGNGYEQLALDFTQADDTDDRALHMDPMEWWAREMAARGNDVYLFAYQPTPSINPPRPRTLAAGYAKSISTLYIRFRNGSVYGYYNVTPNIWRNFRRAKSPGRYINRVLNFYPYAPEPDLDMPTGNR